MVTIVTTGGSDDFAFWLCQLIKGPEEVRKEAEIKVRQRIEGWARVHTNDAGKQEHLVDHVLDRVIQLGAKLLDLRKPAAFLRQVLRNRGKDLNRRDQVVRFHPLESDQFAAIEPGFEGVERAERRELVRKAIKALPEEIRTIVEMHIYEEKPFRQIAKELGLSRAVVFSRWKRALGDLRDLLPPGLDES